MATIEEAEMVRAAMAEKLRLAGAHAISVEPIDPGDKGYAIVAFFVTPPKSVFPNVLVVSSGEDTLRVRLVVRISAPFAPE